MTTKVKWQHTRSEAKASGCSLVVTPAYLTKPGRWQWDAMYLSGGYWTSGYTSSHAAAMRAAEAAARKLLRGAK